MEKCGRLVNLDKKMSADFKFKKMKEPHESYFAHHFHKNNITITGLTEPAITEVLWEMVVDGALTGLVAKAASSRMNLSAIIPTAIVSDRLLSDLNKWF